MEDVIKRNYLIKCYQFPDDTTCELVLMRYEESLDFALSKVRFYVTRYPKVEFFTIFDDE